MYGFHKKLLAEFIGTMLLVLVGVGAAVISGSQIGLLGISLAFGLVITALVYIFGSVSGCHINPAVSLGLFLARRFEGRYLIPYIIVQLLGGLAGAYIIYLIASGKVGFDINGFGCTGYGEHSPQQYSMFAAGLVELVVTTLLINVVLCVTRFDFPIGFAPLTIGATLTVIHLLSLPVTNTSANFARSFATAFIVKGWALEQLSFFAAIHGIAAVLAVVVYCLVHGCCCREGQNCS